MEEARMRANSLKLYDYDRDPETGRELTGASNRRLFSLFTLNPLKVGKASMALGLYFTSLTCFLIVSIVLSIVTTVAVFDNASNLRFNDTYTLLVPEPRVVDAYGVRPTTYRQEQCKRTYEVTTPITRVSAGSRCLPGDARSGADERTSLLHCPSVCRYTASADRPEIVAADLVEPCKTIQPCQVSWNGGKCCTLTLKTKDVEAMPALQSWVVFAHTLVFLLMMLLFETALNFVGSNLNAENATVGDFTAYVERLPIPMKAAQDDEKALVNGKQILVDFFSHYGEVAKVCHVHDVGKVLETAERIRQLERARDELAAYDKRTVQPYFLSEVMDRIYWLVYTGKVLDGTQESVEKAIGAMNAKVDAQKQRLREEVDSGRHQRTVGEAIVVFNYEKHANNCFNDLAVENPVDLLIKNPGRICATRPSIRSMMEEKLGRPLHESSELLKSSTGIDHVRVFRAPEPSDLIWTNTSVRGLGSVWRILVSNSVVLLVVIIGALIQNGFESIKNAERSKMIDAEVSSVDDSNDDDSNLGVNLIEIAKLRGLTIASAFFIVLVNQVIVLVTKKMAEFERWHIKSSMQKYLIAKLSIAQILNAAIIPIIAAGNSDKSTWFIRGGLAEEAFWVQLSNAILPDIVQALDPSILLADWFAPRHARSQQQLDYLLEPKEFDMAVRYSVLVKSLGLAVFYYPLQPLSYYVCFAGMVVSFGIDRYAALRSCRKPAKLSNRVPQLIPLILRIFLVVQIILTHNIMFPSKATINSNGAVTVDGSGMVSSAYILSFFVCAVFGLLSRPIRVALGINQDFEREEGGTRDLPYMEFVGQRRRKITAGGYRTTTAVSENDGDIGEEELLHENQYEAYTPFLNHADALKHLPPDYVEYVEQIYKLPAKPYPANKQLMARQLAETGGEFYTLPPADQLRVRAGYATAQTPTHSDVEMSTAGFSSGGGTAALVSPSVVASAAPTAPPLSYGYSPPVGAAAHQGSSSYGVPQAPHAAPYGASSFPTPPSY